LYQLVSFVWQMIDTISNICIGGFNHQLKVL